MHKCTMDDAHMHKCTMDDARYGHGKNASCISVNAGGHVSLVRVSSQHDGQGETKEKKERTMHGKKKATSIKERTLTRINAASAYSIFGKAASACACAQTHRRQLYADIPMPRLCAYPECWMQVSTGARLHFPHHSHMSSLPSTSTTMTVSTPRDLITSTGMLFLCEHTTESRGFLWYCLPCYSTTGGQTAAEYPQQKWELEKGKN
eukprot:1157065-Pelagomonas_calceolata.AAC.15